MKSRPTPTRILDDDATKPAKPIVLVLLGAYCEGFRMPALPGRVPSRGSGAGVRKPPKKETASRKGAYPPPRAMGI